MNNYKEIYEEGFLSFKEEKNFYQSNPYNKIEQRGEGVETYQVEAVPFFNGWEARRKEYFGVRGYSLFLDDFRFPNWVTWVDLPKSKKDNWILVRHYYDFIETVVEYGLPRFIAFDFDLDRHNLPVTHLPYGNGADCAAWLVDYCKRNWLPFPEYKIHSCNPEGHKRIQETINNEI